jgi:hypothetical protein
VSGADSGVEVLRALAKIRRTLGGVASERERQELTASYSVAVSDYAGGILTVEVFFYLTDADGVETEWFAEARSAPGQAGWVVRRNVAIQELVEGEVRNLGGGEEIADVACADSSSLAAELPSMVEELLAVVPSRAQ